MIEKFVLLSKRFYDEYPSELYPEMQQKEKRPYLVVIVTVRDLTFAIPMRHHIAHRFSFITNKPERWGLDYTKSVVITSDDFISDIKRQVLVDENEYYLINENKARILRDFQKYLDYYERAVLRGTPTRDPVICFSALQYFHKELGISYKSLIQKDKKITPPTVS